MWPPGSYLRTWFEPRRQASAATDYGYKQLAYEPILGGGLITALSVPLIAILGLPAFTIASMILVVLVGFWGIARR